MDWSKVEKMRNEIDEIDRDIFKLLKKRFSIVVKIGVFKKRNKLSIRNKQREKDLIEKMIKITKMDSDFIKNFYKILFSNSYKIEK